LRVYLAGPIFEQTDEQATEWRKEATRLARDYGIGQFDPMARDYRGKQVENKNAIVVLDKREIRSSDVVLVNWTKPSAGTSMEIMYAYERGIPTVVVNADGVMLSPWVLYHATHITDSLEDAFDWISCRVRGA
jgi:nucleoside 2-deoxyribosyltransferase